MEYYFNLFIKQLGDLTDKVPRQVIVKSDFYKFSFRIDWNDDDDCEIEMYAYEKNDYDEKREKLIATSDIKQRLDLWDFDTEYYIEHHQWTISLPPM